MGWNLRAGGYWYEEGEVKKPKPALVWAKVKEGRLTGESDFNKWWFAVDGVGEAIIECLLVPMPKRGRLETRVVLPRKKKRKTPGGYIGEAMEAARTPNKNSAKRKPRSPRK